MFLSVASHFNTEKTFEIGHILHKITSFLTLHWEIYLFLLTLRADKCGNTRRSLGSVVRGVCGGMLTISQR